ncbi:hypothetical protein Tco_1038913, partial [Tanacetum coccineum]
SLFWREDLDGDRERGFKCITFALVCRRLTAKGIGLRVVDSHTGNHPEDGFTPVKTIQRLLVVIGRRSYSGFEGEAFEPERRDTIAVQRYGLSAKELNEFLSFYPIPLEYDVILPKSTKTIFDAPPGYVGLYIHYFSLANLRLPLTDFFCKCLGRYPTSVRVFDDPILFLAGLKPSWELGQQWPTIIVGGKEMDFRNFIYTEDDDLAFFLKESSLGFGTGSPSALVNTELPKDVEEPEVQPAEVTTDSGESLKDGVFVMHPGSVAAHIKERKCKTRGGSSRPPVKRKLAFGSSSSCVVRAKNSSFKDDDPILSISDDDEGLPDCFELKDANACHLKISAITPPSWKGHWIIKWIWNYLIFMTVIKKMRSEADVIKAKERSHNEECEDLQVKCKDAMAEFDQNLAVLVLREKMSSLTADVKELKGNLDRMMLESQNWVGYQVTLSNLESKVDSLEAEKARLEGVEASLHREVEELKQDRRDIVSNVVPYAALELVHSDELGMLVGTLVSSAITYGHFRAYEQVDAMKEPFDLSKAKGYRSSYKKEHTQDSNDFATATFPWLDEFTTDVVTPIEAMLSKKPPVKGSCVALSCGQMYSALSVALREKDCVTFIPLQRYLLSDLPEVRNPGILPHLQFPFPGLCVGLLAMLRILLHCRCFKLKA